MWCPNCNEQTPDNSVLCRNCGCQIDNSQQTEIDEKQTATDFSGSSIKKRNILIASIVSAIVVLAIVIGVLVSNHSPLKEFSRYLEANDFEKAALCVAEMSAQDKQGLALPLYNKAKELYTAYNLGTLKYEEVKEAIEQLQMICSTKELGTVVYELSVLRKSKAQYAAAQTETDKVTAIQQYQAVIPDDALYRDAQEKATKLLAEYKQEILQKATALTNEKAYSEAIDLLTLSYSLLKNDKEISDLIDIYETAQRTEKAAELLQLAQGYAAEGNYPQAIVTLNPSSTLSEELAQKLAEYKEIYRSETIANAQALAKDGKYEEAVLCLNPTFLYLGEDDEIARMIEEYTHKFPVSLGNLDPCAGSNYWTENVHKDIWGNIFTKGLRLGNDSTAKYVVNRQYRTLTGTIMVSSDSYTTPQGVLNIYVDDVLVYTSPKLTKETEPIPISVDISGAKFIRFEFKKVSGYLSIYPLLSNPLLCY